MNIDKLFQINSRLEVAKLYAENTEDEGLGQSLIQDIYENSFLIAVPIKDGHILYLTQGDEVMIWLKVDNARYAFESVVLNEKVETNVKYLELQKPQKLVPSDRRNFVRIKTLLTVNYQIIKNEEINDWEKIEPHGKAAIIDLSGQGLGLALKIPLPKDVMMVLSIRLEHINVVLKVLGKVVRSEKHAGLYKIGAKFENISERQQDQVIKYVFYVLRKHIQTMRND